jgi:hypothetical protein
MKVLTFIVCFLQTFYCVANDTIVQPVMKPSRGDEQFKNYELYLLDVMNYNNVEYHRAMFANYSCNLYDSVVVEYNLNKCGVATFNKIVTNCECSKKLEVANAFNIFNTTTWKPATKNGIRVETKVLVTFYIFEKKIENDK